MKLLRFAIFLLSSLLFLSASDCKPKERGQYKGRLEIAGICMNYTVSVLEGPIDTTRIDTSWTDENTAKTYHNVFGLEDPCSFPKNISAGDEFYFNIDTSTAPRPCTVCEAFYPTPGKMLRIIVTGK